MNSLIFAYDWENPHGTKNSMSNGISKDRYEYLHSQNPELITYESFPELQKRATFLSTSEISDNQSYVYNIPIKNISNYFLPKFSDGIQISTKVRNDICSGKALLLFDYTFEGHLYLNDTLSELENLIRELELPRNRILLIHGDFNVRKFQSPYFQYEPVDIFPSWLQPTSIPLSYNPQKLYVSFNRQLGGRLHRIVLLGNLYKENLLDSGYVSIGRGLKKTEIDYIRSFDYGLSIDTFKYIIDHADTSPDFMMSDYYSDNHAMASKANVDLHTNSFLSLVSETHYEKELSFISEKTYKPLSIGHPFILNGNPYTLRRLHNMGFKTFNDWWSEDYDSIENWVERIHEIVGILKEISTWSTDKLIDVRKQMSSVLAHNQEVFRILNAKTIHSPNEYSIVRKYLYEK